MKNYYEKRLKQTELKHTMFILELSRELEDIADKYDLLVRSGEQFGEKGKALTDKLEQLAEIAREQLEEYLSRVKTLTKRIKLEEEGYAYDLGDNVWLDSDRETVYEIIAKQKEGERSIYDISRNGQSVQVEESRLTAAIPF